MSTILIRGGRILDPASRRDEPGDLWIADGRIARGPGKPDRTIDASGRWVVPGLIDMHVHLREPGREDKETIAGGAAAAVAGGFTSVAAMANAGQPVDSAAGVAYVRARAAETGLANVFPVGAVSKGLAGQELAELGTMAQAGAVAFSDDGHPIANSELLRRALEYARPWNKVVISHCEDTMLTRDAVMNEGRVSVELGLRGWPAVAEASVAARDALLARLTGGRLHLAHVSARETVDILRFMKAAGAPVSAEAAPHHLTCTEECLRAYESRFKVNPPLRAQADVDALVAALADGTIDAIASDHAPHTVEEKERELAACPNGVVGLETTLGVVLTDLVATGRVSAMRTIEAMTTAPARILGIDRGTLADGAVADVTIVDPHLRWTVDPARFRSRGRSSPFTGRELRGAAVVTLVGGRVVYER
ncbi:MAG: dihydroorotase [Planctomycetes bacterium]|nr:dihydroorotase [Planctomycetota bacterium]